MQKIFCICILVVGILSSEFGLACTAMDSAQLQAKLKHEPVSQLVFFASWCSSCKKDLREDLAAKSFFIAVFDEQAAAEKAIRAVMGDQHLPRCIWDKDGSIAAFYAVKSLPALRSVAAP